MSITITSKTLSDYDAQLAFNTATALLKNSDLASYLIKQLENQKLSLEINVSIDPDQANKDSSVDGFILWSLRSDTLVSRDANEAIALLSRAPIEQKSYIASQLNLLHLLALACQQLNSQLNFRDADATWPWLDEDELQACDIENAVARELNEACLPSEQSWDEVLKRA